MLLKGGQCEEQIGHMESQMLLHLQFKEAFKFFVCLWLVFCLCCLFGAFCFVLFCSFVLEKKALLAVVLTSRHSLNLTYNLLLGRIQTLFQHVIYYIVTNNIDIMF